MRTQRLLLAIALASSLLFARGALADGAENPAAREQVQPAETGVDDDTDESREVDVDDAGDPSREVDVDDAADDSREVDVDSDTEEAEADD